MPRSVWEQLGELALRPFVKGFMSKKPKLSSLRQLPVTQNDPCERNTTQSEGVHFHAKSKGAYSRNPNAAQES